MAKKTQEQIKATQTVSENFGKTADKILSKEPGAVGDTQVIKRHRRTRAEIEASRSPAVSDQPNPAYRPIISTLFNIIGNVTDCQDIKTKADEYADRLALPVTQLSDYYMPKVKGIYIVWANLLITAGGITMELRSYLAKKEADKIAQAELQLKTVPGADQAK